MRIDLSVEELLALIPPKEREKTTLPLTVIHPYDLSQALFYALNGRKVEAIKRVRTALGLGVRDAKDMVEGNFTGTGLPSQE